MKMGTRLISPDLTGNHFLNFSQQKKRGTVRVGAFGDSFTLGTDVYSEASYPSQLQKLLDDHFPSQKVEVLNFGVPGQSFQEQFFLWEHYAKLYGIDYVLYGPRGLFYNRDLTLGKNWINEYLFVAPKNRFILLKKGGIRQISLKGSSPETRYKNYYTLLPSFIALRYDIRPFLLWEEYFPFLRRKLPNPFYYSNLPKHIESPMINQTLLKKIKISYDKKILLFTINKHIFKNYQTIKDLYNLNYFDSFSNRVFYRMFGHLSSLGNEIAAHIYFNALIGNKKFNLNIISCYFNEKKKFVSKNLRLDNVTKIHIGSKHIPIGEVGLNSIGHWNTKDSEVFFQSKLKNTKSFIGFFGSSVNDFGLSPYFLLPFELNERSKILIKFPKGEIVFLGQIKAVDTFGKFFNFYTDYTKTKFKKGSFHVHLLKKSLPFRLKEKLSQYHKQKIYLLIDDYVLGELLPAHYEEPSLLLKSTKISSFIMIGSKDLVKEQQLSKDFPLYIHWTTNDGQILKSLIPEWSCQKEKYKYHLNLPNFNPLKKKAYQTLVEFHLKNI